MRNLFLILLTIITSLGVMDDAQARRRSISAGKSVSGHSMPVIIPIPRSGSSVVFVKELPDIKQFSHEGEHFDLGYKFGFFGGGEWVGHFRKTSRYVELNQDVVTSTLLPMLGLTAADAPTRKASQLAGGGAKWAVIAALVVGFGLIRSTTVRKTLFSGLAQGKTKDVGFDEAAADKMISAALRKNQPQPMEQRTSQSQRAAYATPRAGFGNAQPAFGRRTR